MGEMTLDLGKIDVKTRICKIVKGSVLSLDDGKLHDIGSGNDTPASHYVYFNDMKELTNSSLSAWVEAASPNIYIITNKVWYKQMKPLYKTSKFTNHSSQYVIKRGVLWEVGAFVSAYECEQKKQSKEQELLAIEKEYGPFISTNAIANQIVQVNAMTAKAFKAKFRKLILYCRTKCLCKLSNYYNYCYSNARRTHYSVEIQIDDETFYGYVKKDDPFGEEIFNTLKDGKSHYMTLGISYPLGSDENGVGWAEHVQIVFATRFNYDKAFTKDDKSNGIRLAAKIQQNRIVDILLDFSKISNQQNRDTLLKGYVQGVISKYEYERLMNKMNIFENGINEYINFFKFNEF